MHTPGPWIIEPHDPSSRGHWLHDEDGKFVALVVKRDEGGAEMELANARLTAAAPDMLAALTELCDRLGPRWFLEQNWAAPFDAIAKAEGTAR